MVRWIVDSVRTKSELVAAEYELFERLWYHRHLTNRRQMQGRKAAAEIEARYAKGTGPLTDDEAAVLEGKLSAIRWALGEEWDMLDT